MGFTFDDAAAAKGEAESLEKMRALIERDSRNAERIFPYIGGEEVNTDPRHSHRRYVIDFEDFPLRRAAALSTWRTMNKSERDAACREGVVPSDYPQSVAADWPDLLEIVERLVKPQRDGDSREIRRRRWWRFGDRQPALYRAIKKNNHVLAISRVTAYNAFARVRSEAVFSDRLAIVASEQFPIFAIVSSRLHDLWALKFGSTMAETALYTPSDCFRTFPFPENFETACTLEAIGEAYHAFRATLMIERNEGLTKTYNRFHARGENAPDIARLRALHAQMDAAVLRAYGWDDLAARAAPEFIEQDTDEGKTPKTRLDWPAEFKDEVLARLLALNAQHSAVERAAGLIAAPEDDVEESDVDE
jgi:hypothetical protein